MKRDMELIRQMVLAIEDFPSGFAPKTLNIEGYTKEQVSYPCPSDDTGRARRRKRHHAYGQ